MQFEDFALFLQKITVWMKPKRNGQEAKAEKKWLISQGQEEMGDKQKPIKHNKKTVQL